MIFVIVMLLARREVFDKVAFMFIIIFKHVDISGPPSLFKSTCPKHIDSYNNCTSLLNININC